jgi:hypothetical protein
MDLKAICEWRPPALDHSYDFHDTILYALGLGYGSDPLDEKQLPFVYEKGLVAVPSYCCVLAHPGFWLQDSAFGVDWVKILHAEQAFEIHKPLPASGNIRGTFRVMGVEDKGAAKEPYFTKRKFSRIRNPASATRPSAQHSFYAATGGAAASARRQRFPGNCPSANPTAL